LKARIFVSTAPERHEQYLRVIRDYVIRLSRRWSEIRPSTPFGHGFQFFRYEESYQADTPSEINTFADIKLCGVDGVHASQPAIRYGEGLAFTWMEYRGKEPTEEVREYYPAGSSQRINLLLPEGVDVGM
jgi:hypothetical protein